MKTPKKRITLKTPKRTTKNAFKSDFKHKTHLVDDHIQKDSSNIEIDNSITDILNEINNLDAEIKNTEINLIESLQRENEYLKNNNLYIKLLGLDISQDNGKYVIKYNINKNKRFIHFELVPEDDLYVYRLVKHSNLKDLGFLDDEISFEREQITKFFYKVMEIMISD